MKHTCIIRDSTGNTLATTLRDHRNGLYRLVGDTLLHCSKMSHVPTEFALSCTTDLLSSFDLWHRRLGHYHPQGLRRMIASHAVKGLPNIRISNAICHSCLGGKQTRAHVPKSRTHYTTKILEQIHTDVTRPFRVQSLGGSSYFLTFIDDFLKKTWVYFLCSKNQCFEKFKFFHQAVEKQSGCRIMTLRSNNGGEFTSRQFQDYCSNHGIHKQYSQPYTPQHNGIAEWRNRTILNIVRCLLIESHLLARLWVEAVLSAYIILNLRSSKRSPDKTPHELFSGIKPDISKLRIFGTTTYVFDTKPNKNKLDPRSWRYFYLSFDNHVKGYRCYDPLLQRVIISKDVQFLETVVFPSLASSAGSTVESSPLPVTGPSIPISLPTYLSFGSTSSFSYFSTFSCTFSSQSIQSTCHSSFRFSFTSRTCFDTSRSGSGPTPTL
jgi:transposase InsO family protein